MQPSESSRSIGLIGLVAAALLALHRTDFSAGIETLSRQAGGRAAVGGAGEFSFDPDRRWTDRELESRADLVGQQVQRRRKGCAVPQLSALYADPDHWARKVDLECGGLRKVLQRPHDC